MAPELWSALQSLISAGALHIVAGRLTRIEAADGGMSVSLRRREAIRVSAVVNCTGPESDVRRLRDPLIEDLLRRKTASCDAGGLGLRVDEIYRAISASGARSHTLSVSGPLLKGEFWEATAVPELRVHAARLAERLVTELALEGVGV